MSSGSGQVSTIGEGLGVVRYPLVVTPQMEALTVRLQEIASGIGDVVLRPFAPPDPSDNETSQAALWLLRPNYVKAHLGHVNIPDQARSVPLLTVVETIVQRVPALAENSPKVAFKEADQEMIFRATATSTTRESILLSAVLGQKGTRHFLPERRATTQAIEQAAGLPPARWDPDTFRIAFATVPYEHRRAAQAMASVIQAATPLEVTFGPAQFHPDPRS